MTLKTKLVLAQAPLAVALGAMGVVSGLVTSELGAEATAILADNHRSVLAAQKMKESLEEIDRAALFAFARGDGGESPRTAPHRDGLEAALRTQEGNITEPGETEITAGVRRDWMRYQIALGRFQGLSVGERRAAYFAELYPVSRLLKSATDQILTLNQDAMVRKSTRVERRAERFLRLVVLAVLGAALLGLIASISLTSRLLLPVGIVAAAVRRFGQGDTRARARIAGEDEIAQLGAEFNTMADRLERYRSSSLGELLQAQQAAQAAIDGLPDPVLLLDAGGKLLGVNNAASLLNIDPEGTTGDPLAGVDPRVRAVLERFRVHVMGGRVLIRRVVTKNPSGSTGGRSNGSFCHGRHPSMASPGRSRASPRSSRM